MKLLRGLVRTTAYLLAAFLIVSGILDILGLMPHSNETPPLRDRVITEIPLMLAAAVLLVPMKPCARGLPYVVLNAAYVVLTLAVAKKLVDGIADYFAGHVSWQITPMSLLIAAIVVGNAVILWSTRAGRRAQADVA
jgi:NO-binding membrane sensor protein with MHYT domain